MTIPFLQAQGICKAFPGVQALQDVNLNLGRGEVLAVVGENGAGKSTLMKILGGVYRADAGTITLDGRAVHFTSVDQAQKAGIVLIHQELNLAENLDIAANIFLGREPTWGGPLQLLRRRIASDAEPILRRIGLDFSPRTLVASLSIGQQQMVEIARALSLQSRILIMDEPTSSLTQRETERLYEVIRDLKRDGISVLYISHRLKEVEIIADRVTVLRDGRNAGELSRSEIRHEAMVRLMVGRELKQFFQRTRAETPGQNVLEVRSLRWAGPGEPVNFNLRAGEIVGMAGLIGAGRTELAETMFGVRPRTAGEIRLLDKPLRVRKPIDAIRAGIYLVPEDRRTQGLLLPESVRDNIALPSLERLQFLRLVARRRERQLAEAACRNLNIRAPSIRQTVGLLSGGNQQKVVLAKWLGRSPRLLILDEPTRGVDVGAKTEIYALMDKLASQGLAILMISSDLEEILGMSDRVLVMHEGSLVGELPRGQLSEEAIMKLATGGAATEKN
ncbi:MAG TPA: sugar ABC transporter ATP-binding protein [Gemmataceae bacterium]|nr:sugar ABC transporter ATP-binding protein [Gemmataceae bacterium]